MVIQYKINEDCISALNPYGVDLYNDYTPDPNAPFPANLWSDVFRMNLTIEDLPSDYEATVSCIFERLKERQTVKDLGVKQMEMHYRDGMTLKDISLASYGSNTNTSSVMNNIRSCIGILRREFFLILQHGKEASSRMMTEKTGPWNTLNRPCCELCFSNVTTLFLRKLNVLTIQQLINIDWPALYKNNASAKINAIKKEVEYKLASIH